MFKIAKANAAVPLMTGSLNDNHQNHQMLAQLSVSESWTADFSTGLICLSKWSAMLHGISADECGLLNLIRCYDTKDRSHVLELFEKAATHSSSFCFSTTIITRNGFRQPLFCMGESSGLEEKYSGRMAGVFIFPRFKLQDATQTTSWQ
ncbi:hypothetical protein [Rhizobium binae]|uniref:hypothetical protein n=1 Tax=Rhizobium binae TaxID=1138190 RepID=UPI001C832B02|nr:hypothetical protein [Rhizobium binae]MBX4970933.1 hypothetical protein [Rhizobium binae]